jgi:hypothetical protein
MKTKGDGKPGEFADLLRGIETEKVPERLLELAVKLQAALVAQREADADKNEHPGCTEQSRSTD